MDEKRLKEIERLLIGRVITDPVKELRQYLTDAVMELVGEVQRRGRMVDDLLAIMERGVYQTEYHGDTGREWLVKCIYCKRRWYQRDGENHRDDCAYWRFQQARDWKSSYEGWKGKPKFVTVTYIKGGVLRPSQRRTTWQCDCGVRNDVEYRDCQECGAEISNKRE